MAEIVNVNKNGTVALLFGNRELISLVSMAREYKARVASDLTFARLHESSEIKFQQERLDRANHLYSIITQALDESDEALDTTDYIAKKD